MKWNGMEFGMEWNGVWNGMECVNNKKSNDVHFVVLKIRPSTVIVTVPASCPLERKHFETQQFR